MRKYGVFISHRHEDWALAGRVYDYLENQGFQPFLDADSMRQGNFHDALLSVVSQTPYFLCLLTASTFKSLDPQDWLCREVRTALETGRKILLLAEKGFSFPADLPKEIEPISHCHCYEVDRDSFLDVMRRICREDLHKEDLLGILDWRRTIGARSNTYMSSRKRLERHFSTLDDRFGPEFVRCVREGREYTGENRIRTIQMSCYAASVLFSNSMDMMDAQAFDRGLMFNIFAQLLRDEDFSMEIVINAPGCAAAQDAIDNDKLGNSALEADLEAVFLSSYCGIRRLIADDPIFQKAHQNKRFRFVVTENVLPYALFHMTYKEGYEKYDHVKVDLYSEGLVSNMERRCMVIFREDDPENYTFFVERYNYVRNVKESKKLIRQSHQQWLEDWEGLKEEMGL